MSDEMTGAEARAIDEWIIGRLTVVLDNTQYAWNRLTAAAHEAVTEGMGTGMGREQYELMYSGRSGDRYEWTAVVGLYVADAIEEMIIDGMPDDMWRMALIDILTLHSSATRDVLGEHYLPEPRYVEWPTEQCGVCGGDDGGCTPDRCEHTCAYGGDCGDPDHCQPECSAFTG